MSNNDYIELVEDINSNADKYLVSPIITGYHASLFRDKINEENPDDSSIADNVFSNAIQSLSYFINPMTMKPFECNCQEFTKSDGTKVYGDLVLIRKN